MHIVLPHVSKLQLETIEIKKNFTKQHGREDAGNDFQSLKMKRARFDEKRYHHKF